MTEDDGFRELIGTPSDLLKCEKCGQTNWACSCIVSVSDPIEDMRFAFDTIRFGQKSAEDIRELRFKLGRQK